MSRTVCRLRRCYDEVERAEAEAKEVRQERAAARQRATELIEARAEVATLRERYDGAMARCAELEQEVDDGERRLQVATANAIDCEMLLRQNSAPEWIANHVENGVPVHCKVSLFLVFQLEYFLQAMFGIHGDLQELGFLRDRMCSEMPGLHVHAAPGKSKPLDHNLRIHGP